MRLRVTVASFGTSILLVIGIVGGVAVAAPSTIYVGKTNCSNSGPGTQATPYCTVQKGLNAVTAGGTVSVAKGTYVEQVTFQKDKDNITLKGSGNGTVIQIPADTDGAIVYVKDTGAVVEDLEVAGPFTTNSCNDNEYGIMLDKGSSADIQADKISQIEESSSADLGCQQGVAVQVNNATATVSDSTISDYQKNGFDVSGDSSNVTISANSVTGYGPTTQIAQNGIEIDNGTAVISQNTVKDNIYSPQTYAATGLLLFSPAHVTVSQNTVNSNDVGIYLDGIKNSSVSQNTANNSTFNGIYADSSTKNDSFTQNSAHGTSAGADNYDMEDDSTGHGTLGTANTWHQNSCKTSSPANLCKQ